MRNIKNHRVELASGVDALYLSSHHNIPQELFQSLLNQRNALGNASLETSPIDFGGEEFILHSRGWGKYPIQLNHRNAQLGFSNSAALPSVRIQFRSEFLHSTDLESVVSWITQILDKEGIAVQWKVSRLDLFVDIQGWDLASVDSEHFFCRADSFHSYSESKTITGFVFGRRKTSTILARIYNKTEQIQSEGKQWTQLIWNDSYLPSLPVWRIEFEIGTQFFRECNLLTLDDVLSSLGSIWNIATEWLTHRVETNDSNQARWPISNDWEFIQNASLAAEAIPLDRISENKKKNSLEGLLAGCMGYFTSVAAYSKETELSKQIDFVLRSLFNFSKITNKPIGEIIAAKASKVAQL